MGAVLRLYMGLTTLVGDTDPTQNLLERHGYRNLSHDYLNEGQFPILPYLVRLIPVNGAVDLFYLQNWGS